MNKLPLTIIILTNRNDNRFIKSLESAQIAKEVIVVDNQSGNNWSELKKNFDFRIVEYNDPIENFSQVRNFAISESGFEWVLFLDSDEVLAANADEAIQEVILGNLYDGVMVERKDIFLGKKLEFGEAGTMQLLRLFKKDKARFNRAIHEVAKVNGKVGSSDIVLHHFAHTNITEFIKDITWYSEQVAHQKVLDRSTLLFQLVIYPPTKFFVNYIFKLGFLDGWRGLTYAVIMSLHSLSVRVFNYEQSQQIK